MDLVSCQSFPSYLGVRIQVSSSNRKCLFPKGIPRSERYEEERTPKPPEEGMEDQEDEVGQRRVIKEIFA